MENSGSTQPATTRKHGSLMPFSLTPSEEELMKFAIGLQLLGDVRQQRYLTYLRQLIKQTTQPASRPLV